MPSDQPAQDVVDLALRVAGAFESIGVEYFLGGSLATSFQGEARATNDIDFVVELAEHKVPALARALGDEFVVDEPSLIEAIRDRSSWNIYYLPLVTKIDLFIRANGPFDLTEFSRRRRIRLGERELFIKSPEDSVLRKLLWYREGGEVSTKQWRDVVEVLRVSGPRLDAGYLDRWARQLALEPLLARARLEAR